MRMRETVPLLAIVIVRYRKGTTHSSAWSWGFTSVEERASDLEFECVKECASVTAIFDLCVCLCSEEST